MRIPVTGAVRYHKLMQHKIRLDDDSFLWLQINS